MKSNKYLNGVLSVIAVCLVVITMAITGLIPKANAGNLPNKQTVSVPLNPDGSINVKLVNTGTLDVNIDEVGGYSTYGTVEVKIKN